MENNSDFSTFIMTGFGEMENMKYLYSLCTLLGYLIILSLNLLLIVVIALEESLHKPMYILICNLAVNGIYGSTAFFPKLIADLLSDIHTISRAGCLTQVFFVRTSTGVEITILAVMAYDRYVCICNPLRYTSIMTYSVLSKLLAVMWIHPLLVFVIVLMFTERLPLCGSVIHKIYCDNWSIVNLSCVDTSVNNIVGIFAVVLVIGLPVVFILISYILILQESIRVSKEAQGKAIQTCSTHIIAFLSFVFTFLFEVTQHRFDIRNVPHSLRVIMSVQYLIIPPLLNPIIYGVRTREIKIKIIKLLKKRV
uniref:Olfactory receptor n=2 Tax=Latimeria chalumnae TaxID=7897 RepID=H3ACX6_LATCH